MDTHTLKIARPCPIDLDVDRSRRQFFCDHCQKDVHVLANWPRAEAEAFIAANRGNSVCVSLRRDSQGDLLYADSPARTRPAELVPAARLRRRWLPEAAAAAGVVAALSACTPHQPARSVSDRGSDDDAVARAWAGGVTVPDTPPPPSEVLEGELADPEPRLERGEKPAVQPPPAPPRKPSPKPRATKQPEPPPPEPEILDGGIDF